MPFDRKTIREIAACGLGLRLPPWPGRYYTITAVSGKAITVPDLLMDLAEEHGAEDLYFNHEKAFAEANQIRVDRWDTGRDVVTLGKAPTGVAKDEKCEFYVAMPAAEVNVAIDEALQSLWYIDQGEVALTADQNEIDITASLSWLKNSGQLLELIYREVLATKRLAQRPVAEFETDDVVESGAQKLRVYLWDHPADVADKTLQVRGKHYYDGLAEDTTTTTCPQPLTIAAVRVRIISRLPVRLKEIFGDRILNFDRDLAEARLQFLPLAMDRPLRRRDYWGGPEVPIEMWSW